jgi:hypothetical protein
MSLYFTPSSNPHTQAPTQRTVISQRKLSTSPGRKAKRMELIEIAKTKIAEKTNGKAPLHLPTCVNTVAASRLRDGYPWSGLLLHA